MVVLKTPRNKIPKGQNSQSMRKRKASFELQGKKTPGKTPQKNNSSPVKKQATPMAKGKTTVQEFKGMNGNEVQQKKQQVESMQAEEDRKRNLKSLFVGNLPSDVTVNELKGLSPDIESVNMPFKQKDRLSRFAFLMFSSAAKAESNYKTLQNKKLRGESLSIDFVGEKSLNKPSVNILDKVPKKTYNLKRLFIRSVPLDATVADIAIHFPKAFQVALSSSPVSGSANIDFREEDAAAEGFKLREIEVNGQKLMVHHSLAATPKKNKRRQKKRLGKPHRGARPPAKKMKVQKGKKDE